MITKVPNIPRGADIASIGAIVGMAIGRIGDIINGEHFSKTTDLPWGVVYTDPNSPSFLRFGANAEPQHPAVAYELIGDLAIFVILLVIYFRVPRAGVTFFAWVFLYGALRTAVSFLRLDDEVFLGLRTAQVIGVAAMPIGLAGIIYLLRTPPHGEHRAERRRRELPDETTVRHTAFRGADRRLKVTMYTKADCGLCGDVQVALVRLQPKIRFELEFVNIEADPDAYARYWDRIPVVEVDGVEVAAAPIDEKRLLAALTR